MIIIDKLMKEIDIVFNLIDDINEDQFLADEKTQRAVAMTLINMGELVKLLNIDFRNIYPEIPWRSVAGLRDVVAHRYQSLIMEDIWVTVHEDLPVFKKMLSKIK